MKQNTPIGVAALLEEAKASEHKEAYQTLERTVNYRIGRGVRLTPPNPPSFFVEILIYLAPENGKVDLRVLEKIISALRELQERGFRALFQDDNCLSCEAQVPAERLTAEYERDKALMKNIFGG
jgi:hypothetical protein